MHGPPPIGFDEATVAAAVATGWGVLARDLRYLPVGGGGYHWHLTAAAGRALFVTVDDLETKDWLGNDCDAVAHGLSASLSTAWWLRDEAALAFVVAPLAALDGQPLARLRDRFAISVTPYLDGSSYPFGPHGDPARRRRLLDMLIALHAIDPAPGIPDHARPRIGSRGHLEAFLHAPAALWDAGPFGEHARALLAPHAQQLAARLDSFDECCRSLGERCTVITHGEPHAANVMTVGDHEVLIDWDTVGLAMPERDLWLAVDDEAGLDHYAR